MSAYISVNGEKIGRDEYFKIMEMLYHDAKEIAGVFHGENRSEKFRANWPDEDLFVEANWKTFVAAARMMYAERLGDLKTPPEDAKKMHLAIVLQQMAEAGLKQQGVEADNRLQLRPGTQQFDGDAYENKKILEKFGGRKNLRAHLLNETAKLRGTTWH